MNRLRLAIFDLDDTLFDTSGQLDETCEGIENISLFPHVGDLLREIRSKGVSAAIVSTGDHLFQEKKVEILGLRQLVDAVYICDSPEDKLALFKRCLHEFAARPRETLVVGDRIDREILFGRMLGCITVRVLQGKHSSMIPQIEDQVADYTIQSIAALSEVLSELSQVE